MDETRLARGMVVLLLAAAVVLPYPRILLGTGIPIPDDIIISDLADAEFPMRVEAARLLTSGQAPVWTSHLYTGTPLQIFEPVSLLLFSTLPAGLALGWFLALLLVVAALGTYALARHLGAGRPGAFLAGFAFAWSGFFVCQLRHLGELGTVAWFPLAVYCLERAAPATSAAPSGGDRPLLRSGVPWLLGFATIFGLQLLQGFPQSAYICALLYSALVAARALRLVSRRASEVTRRRAIASGARFVVVVVAALAIGALVGAVALLPLWELGSVSDRAGGGSYQWATSSSYWPRNVLTFLVPYANGDISNLTYRGDSIFWEDYGYVGLATLLLSFAGAWAGRRRFAARFWGGAVVVSYLLVLGPATPLFRVAYDVVPGMSRFRFPTRFLFVVELGLCLLAGLGLTWIQDRLARRLPAASLRSLPVAFAVTVVAVTAADLVFHNRRQNPFADADRWLSSPRTASVIRQEGAGARVFTPGSVQLHMDTFTQAGGWSGDLTRYYAHREFLQPDSNLLHGVSTLGGYEGISPRWIVDLIGDHNRLGLLSCRGAGQPITTFCEVDGGNMRVAPRFFDWLEALSVRWLILSRRGSHPRMEHVASAPPAELYQLSGVLPRTRVVARARLAPSEESAQGLAASGDFDPRREVMLHDAAAAPVVAAMAESPEPGPAEARIVVDRATEVVVEAKLPRSGLVYLADTYYPGWVATVDGAPAPIFRANFVHRAVPAGPGAHRISFSYRPRSVALGLALSMVGVGTILGAAIALGAVRRLGSRPRAP